MHFYSYMSKPTFEVAYGSPAIVNKIGLFLLNKNQPSKGKESMEDSRNV